MDIYSNHRVPFSVGVWLRSHKFSPTAVRVTKALQLIANREVELATAERELGYAQRDLDAALIEANQKLMDSPDGY